MEHNAGKQKQKHSKQSSRQRGPGFGGQYSKCRGGVGLTPPAKQSFKVTGLHEHRVLHYLPKAREKKPFCLNSDVYSPYFAAIFCVVDLLSLVEA